MALQPYYYVTCIYSNHYSQQARFAYFVAISAGASWGGWKTE